MHLLSQKKQSQVQTATTCNNRSKQKHKSRGNATSGYSTGSFSALQTSPSVPMTPPPPYDANINISIPNYFSTPVYQLDNASRQYLQSPNAFASTLDLSRPYTVSAWQPQPQPQQQQLQNRPWQSTANLLSQRPATINHPECPIARSMNQGAALCDRIAAALTDVLCRSDSMENNEGEIEALARGLSLDGLDAAIQSTSRGPVTKLGDSQEQARSGGGIIDFKKSWLYKNSRLPLGMVPFKAYLPTWTLVCRGAKASVDVYERPRSDQREFYTDADPKLGTKATIIKSQPVDDRNLVIVAVRGSKWNLVDWAVNVRDAPMQPLGFLDDEGNACHAGFLHVARSMIAPVAARLRDLIQKDASCCEGSLLFTGHSAGGAVASLLYAHMASSSVNSDLTNLAGLFKRIHCITFGAPPVSLLPLQRSSKRARSKDVFLSFVNEGDPVVRLDGLRYFLSLSKLVTAPAPNAPSNHGLREKISRHQLRSGDHPNTRSIGPPRWPVPDATLSTAGRAVLLRQQPRSKDRSVEALQVTDEELRTVIFGDPAMHPMVLYKRRVDEIAFAAVSGKDAG